ncbi:MAG: YjbH domain-containing protein [Bacteroidota bacterium]
MKPTILYFLLLWPLLLLTKSYGQSPQTAVLQNIEEALVDLGLKNIGLSTNQKQLVLTYENTRYRFEAQALSDLLDKVGPAACTHFEELVLIGQKQGIEVFHLVIELEDCQAFSGQEGAKKAWIGGAEISYRERPKATTKPKALKEKGFFRAELVLEPQLRLAFGGEPEIVAHQLNLLPRLDVHLWKGALFQLQYILPLSNELQIPEETFVRPGRISFHQVAKLPGQVYSRLSLGYFSQYRYGGELELGRFFFNGQLFIHASIARTGYAAYPIRLKVEEPKAGWEFSDISSWQYRLGVAYWLNAWDLSIRLEHNRVPLGLSRNQIIVERYFNETKIGFFAYRADNRENYGVTLSIPIPPTKYFKHKRLQLRPSRTIEYRYHATQFFATDFDTGHDLERFFDKLNPEFMRRQLSRLTN